MTKVASHPSVLILTHEYPPFRGGIGTYCEQMAAAAASLGHKVTVWAPKFGKGKGSSGNPAVKRFAGGVFKHWQFPLVLLLTLKAVLTHRNSIILAADWPFVAACGLLRRFIPFHYRIMLHGSEILFFKKSKVLNLLTCGNPFYKADAIYANSHFTRDLLYKTYPMVQKSLAHVTYLGMDESWLTDPKAKPAKTILKKLGVAEDMKIVLTVGRLHPRKGQATTIGAISKLPAKLREKTAYLMVGNAVDAEYHAELSKLAKEANFQAVIASGLSNEDVRNLYQLATVYCMPSTSKGTKVEGFGLVFLEAAGSSLPSIAVAQAAVPEVVKHEETGLLIQSDDEKELAKALETILTDDKLRQKLGAAALKHAKTFTWSRCAKLTFGALTNA